jgi:phosphate transport system ATP-binding protein
MSEKALTIRNLKVQYMDGLESLRGISLDVKAHAVNVFFGPAGGGKSTILRTINRLIDLDDVKQMEGKILFHGKNILDKDLDVTELRRKIGVVFSRPIPLPLTICQNVSFGLEAAGEKNGKTIHNKVKKALEQAGLWEEVGDRLDAPASELSGGQQQRLCLARVMALEPEIIMLDEPTSALDPISTAKIEQFMLDGREKYSFILVPNNVSQAARMADTAAFFLQGELIEYAVGKSIFVNPKDKRTQDYIEGRFG